MSLRLHDTLRSGRPALGILQQDGPDLIPYQASAGADFVIIDTMMGSLSIESAARLCWLARAEGLYPFVRLPANPWGAGVGQPDRRFAADAAKALSAGAAGLTWSVASAQEARSVAHLGGDWHQGRPVTSASDASRVGEAMASERLLLPMVESIPALEQLDEILAIDGIDGVFLGMTDLSHQLGHPHDVEHPEVAAVLEAAVLAAHSSGRVVAANTGYQTASADEQVARATRLAELDVDLIMMQTAKFFMYLGLKAAIDGVHERTVHHAR